MKTDLKGQIESLFLNMYFYSLQNKLIKTFLDIFFSIQSLNAFQDINILTMNISHEMPYDFKGHSTFKVTKGLFFILKTLCP